MYFDRFHVPLINLLDVTLILVFCTCACVDMRALACICVVAGVFPSDSSSLMGKVKEPNEVTSSNVGMLPNIYASIHIHIFV